ncbi:MAG: hypothetical protein L0G63_13600 [Psychrobacter sp.]|uniref:hypothetical protein n=1 Tax=Psychrobacter sp. TaxID=56811 RepID=UPI00264865E8|nr:hypothetical protein [Psychrobacter sp.]MDN5621478.1 hypothetical protein [Psychrobacter sp.]
MNTPKNSMINEYSTAMDIHHGCSLSVKCRRPRIHDTALQAMLGFLMIAISAIHMPANAANNGDDIRVCIEFKSGATR